jgi:hypothetical protein
MKRQRALCCIMHKHYLIYTTITNPRNYRGYNIWLYTHNSTFLIYVTATVFTASIVSRERGCRAYDVITYLALDIVISSAHKYGERGNIWNSVPTAIKQFPISFYKLDPLMRFTTISHHQRSQCQLCKFTVSGIRNCFGVSAEIQVHMCKICENEHTTIKA